MSNRKNISYEEAVSLALEVIKEDMEFLYEEDDKGKAQTAMRVSAIIDFIEKLDKATKLVKELIEF